MKATYFTEQDLGLQTKERELVGVSRETRARGVYAISVAAELVGTGQQNLRLYERKGLLEPGRTIGGTRRYSENDLVVLRRIAELLAQGLNISGIHLVLALEKENTALKDELTHQLSRPETQRQAPAGTDTGPGHTQRP